MNIDDETNHSDFQRRESITDGPIRAYAPLQDVWFVVQYKAGLGGRTLDTTMQTLKAEGFEAYHPRFMRMKRPRIDGVRSTTLQPAFEPLFPPYMFVKRTRPGKTAITAIHGLESAFLGAVKGEVIERLRAMEEDAFIRFVDARDAGRHPIKAGDTVETLDGFLRAVVAEERPGGRLALLSGFMQGAAPVVVNLAQVVRVARAEDAAAGKAPKKADLKPGKGGENNPFVKAETLV